MCGRFAIRLSKDQLIQSFREILPNLDANDFPDFAARYNVAPSQMVPAIGQSEGKPHPKLALLQWGFIPHFAKDPKGSLAPINIRSETVMEKPMFRRAFARQRCLVLADGFYEWKREGSAKRPFFFSLNDSRPFAFAGLYETRRGEGTAAPLVSCAIFTTEANEILRPIHDRMPVILDRESYALWCDPEIQDAAKVRPLLKPYPAERMNGYAVSLRVNNPRNDDPSLIGPVAAE